MDESLVTLLHHIDGHLGLAVYRSHGINRDWWDDEAREWWVDEARSLINRIRSAIAALEDS